MALHVHLAELPLRTGQNMAVSGQSSYPQEASGQPWAPVLPPPTPLTPRELACRAGNKTYLGAALLGDPHSKKFSISSLSLFPYLEGERQLGQASTVPRCQPICLLPALGYHPARGTWAQVRSVERLCFPKNVEGAGASLPLSYTPGPGQHVDVSAELSCILGHLLRCGIVPWVHWLQRGPQGTQRWLQQQSHKRGQEQQGEAVACGSHLKCKEWEGR